MHRAGRTGRMGRKGVCVTFLEDLENGKAYLQTIEDKYNMPVEIVTLDDTFEKKVREWID